MYRLVHAGGKSKNKFFFFDKLLIKPEKLFSVIPVKLVPAGSKQGTGIQSFLVAAYFLDTRFCGYDDLFRGDLFIFLCVPCV